MRSPRRGRRPAAVRSESGVGRAVAAEANDCNTGIHLPGGEIVVLGPHIVFHSGSMAPVVSRILLGPEGRRPS
ncbi:hypothetical protein OG936_26685 [Streptomyces sp. NBC_00846]|uniref:hypothetical protein n=1 Tax=Streptomyces sp. NBC_00846 TaxID=2975849 RepID=UPI00386F53DE|nr:hypothetical protein OG936_26685 [Streptomyces sp. NBC_00846]